MTPDHDTIAAPATAPGGAIAVIRVSGSEALRISDRIFRGRRPLASAEGYTVHFGRIVESLPIPGNRTENRSAPAVSSHTGHLSASDRPRSASDSVSPSGSESVPAAGRSETDLSRTESQPGCNRTSGSGQGLSSDGNASSGCASANKQNHSEPQGSVLHSTAAVPDASDAPGAEAPSNESSFRIVDEVLATVFRAPHSYTGEDSVEISCHGSAYIVSEILRLLVAAGARLAQPGEFTVRAYLNGKMDLSQAEAVADLIASSSQAAHTLAVNQLRGGYSSALDTLRGKLLDLVSLLELELDFSEEEVEFADRTELQHTLERIAAEVETMRESFALGNAVKEGVAVALVGAPNVGKSTLLNRLLNEERALVSDIAGTTRDVIEERAAIDGVLFRFLDTAGIRSTDDTLEKMGIERTLKSIEQAQIVIRLLDAASLRNPVNGSGNPDVPFNATDSDGQNIDNPGSDLQSICTPSPDPDSPSDNRPACAAPDVRASDSGIAACPADSSVPASEPHFVPTAAPAFHDTPQSAATGQSAARPMKRLTSDADAAFPLRNDQRLLVAVNKLDMHPDVRLPEGAIGISAKTGEGIDRLRRALRGAVNTEALYHGDAVVSSSRHHEALAAAGEALSNALDSLRNGLPTDLLSEELRPVIRHLGAITGRGIITPDEVLRNIFSKFCIGK